MSCKVCIHYNACKFTYIEAFGFFNEEQFGQTGCAEFEDKSRFVEVCRCKDCKCCDIYFPVKPIDEEATAAYFCKLWEMYTEPTVFCSYGERKEK